MFQTGGKSTLRSTGVAARKVKGQHQSLDVVVNRVTLTVNVSTAAELLVCQDVFMYRRRAEIPVLLILLNTS